jgi:hypothetical protein
MRYLLFLLLSGCSVVTDIPDSQILKHWQQIQGANGDFKPYSDYEWMWYGK